MIKSIPTGVKIISVLHYIGAVLFLLCAILMFISSNFVAATQIESIFGPEFLIIGGIIFIIFSILSFFLGLGLWKGQKWSRIVVIILSILGLVSAIITIISGNLGSIVTLVIYALIAGYLLFSQEVKSAFA